METWKITITGHVQGVGFRWSVQTYANSLNLNGTVRNDADGSVTVCLQTDREMVDYFMQNLAKHISPFAHIDDFQIEKLEGVEKMHSFHVSY